jgi:hypothetical protein
MVAGGAFALDMAIGGGLTFDLSGNNGIKYDDYYNGFRNTSFGAYGFFDLTYVEIGLYFAYGAMTSVVDMGGASGKAGAGGMTQFGFTLLGKYPIELGKITLFPALGIDYNIPLSWKFEGEKVMEESVAKWYSQLGFQAGMGLDLGLTEALFLRFNGMFHLRLPTKAMKDTADVYHAFYGGDWKATLGFGPRINVAIGYKL